MYWTIIDNAVILKQSGSNFQISFGLVAFPHEAVTVVSIYPRTFTSLESVTEMSCWYYHCNKQIINLIRVGFYCHISTGYYKFFTPSSYALCGMAIGCSSPYCKDCQTQNFILSTLSYKMECHEKIIPFKRYSRLCAEIKVIVTMRISSLRLWV
jgi:hypothetical protein